MAPRSYHERVSRLLKNSPQRRAQLLAVADGIAPPERRRPAPDSVSIRPVVPRIPLEVGAHLVAGARPRGGGAVVLVDARSRATGVAAAPPATSRPTLSRRA